MKNKRYIIGAFVLGAIFFSTIVGAATVTLPQNPKKGTVLVGKTTTSYGVLATSTDGLCLKASSTAALGVVWDNCTTGSSITSLNGSTSSSQEFATSGPALSVSSSNGVHTFALPTSSASQAGVLSPADWTAFNGKQNSISFPIPYPSSTHITATAPLVITNGNLDLPTSTSGQNGFLTAADWTTFNGKQDALTNPVTRSTNYKSIQWSASYTTSTQQFDDPVFTFRVTSTIRDIYVSSRDAANTLSWNFVYSTDPTTATSSAFKLLASTQITTSTPSAATHITSFASSTPEAGQTLRLYSNNASSSITTFTIWYTED